MASSSAALRMFSGPLDTQKLQMEQFRSNMEDVTRSISGLQSQINNLKTTQLTFEREFPDVLRQLDVLAGQLEREKGDVAVLKEQLTFLAHGGDRNRNSGNAAGASRSGIYGLLFSIVRYLYDPFLFFARGMYVLLSPIMITFQCLSVFRKRRSKLDTGSSDDDSAMDSGDRSSFAHAQQIKSEMGYLLTTLTATQTNNGMSDGSTLPPRNLKPNSDGKDGARIGGATVSVVAPDLHGARKTPQRGTELYALLQSTKIARSR